MTVLVSEARLIKISILSNGGKNTHNSDVSLWGSVAGVGGRAYRLGQAQLPPTVALQGVWGKTPCIVLWCPGLHCLLHHAAAPCSCYPQERLSLSWLLWAKMETGALARGSSLSVEMP